MEFVKDKKLKIVISTNILSPYRVDWFNELGKYADVSVYYLNDRNAERNDEWLSKRSDNCRFYLMRGHVLPVLGKVSYDFIKAVKRNNYDIIILDGYGFYTQIKNIRYLNKNKIKYFVNFDGIVNPFVKEGIRTKIKRKLILSFPFYLCGSMSAKKYILNLGGEDNRIFTHTFTSLYSCDIYQSVCDKKEKLILRQKLGIKEKYIVISVGRFTYMNGYGKGYDVLLKAAKIASGDIGWYIIGGKPTEEFQNLKDKDNLNNVHFVDFKTKDQLKDYYRSADIFVLMSVGDVWGLVVNEAMACGLPIITSDKCVAGVELIKDNKNGFVVPVGNFDVLANRINSIIFDSQKIEDMGRFSIEIIKDCTIENMAIMHMDIFKQVSLNANK